MRLARNAIERQCPARMNTPFHAQMAGTCIVLLTVSVIGCRVESVNVPGAALGAIGFFLLFVATLPILAYWAQKRLMYHLDASFTIFWVVLVKVLLAYPVVIAARLGMGINLQDGRLAQWDRMLGVNVGQVSAWTHQHWIGRIANASYGLLPYFVLAAILLPILTRRVQSTQRFLTANVIAFVVSLPVFVLIPAVGPWYGIHFLPSQGQVACQNNFLLIRQPGPQVFADAGIICFPSFHAIWSVLCAYPLWGMRWLRIPVTVLSGLILFSTVSTGWHYCSDVAAGVGIAALSIVLSNWLSNQWRAAQTSTGSAADRSSVFQQAAAK